MRREARGHDAIHPEPLAPPPHDDGIGVHAAERDVRALEAQGGDRSGPKPPLAVTRPPPAQLELNLAGLSGACVGGRDAARKAIAGLPLQDSRATLYTAV